MSLIKIEDLKTNMCRWPIGDPQEDNFHFCGCRAMEGRSYCTQHTAMSVRAYDRHQQEQKKAA